MSRSLAPIVLALVAIALATAAAPAAEPQWRPMPVRSQEQYDAGMIGGEGEQHMHSCARSVSDPDVLYLAHDCAQVWRSDDNGQTWNKTLGNGLYLSAAQSIEVDPADPDRVMVIMDNTSNYLVPEYTGLYRSADGGDTWDFVLPTDTTVTRTYRHNIAYDPTTADTGGASRWYAAFPDNRLFRSEDGGQTWTPAADLSGTSPIYEIRAHPDDGQTLYMASADGLSVSTNRGASFNALGNLPGGTVSAVAVNPQNPSIIYAVLHGQGLYRSTDGGTTFTLIRSFDALHVFINRGHPDWVFLVGGSNSLVSHDGGDTWLSVSATPPLGLSRDFKNDIQGEMTGIMPDPRDPDVAVGYSLAMVWRSGDGGRNWVDSSTLFTGHNWGWWNKGMVWDRFDADRFAMFCADVSMIKTTNGGLWWSRHRIPWEWYQQGLVSWIGQYAGDFQPIEGSQVVVGSAGMYFNTKLVRSADGGDNWQIVDDRTENHLFVGFHPGDPDLVFSGNKKSTDAGLTWQEIPFLNDYSASILGMCRAQPDTLYALSRPRDDILRSDDRGQTWRVYESTSWAYTTLDSKPAFAVHPADPDKVYTQGPNRDLAVFDGDTWTELGVIDLAGGAAQDNFIRAVALDPRHPEIIYAETAAAGLPYIFRSTDAGQSWENISDNLSQCGGGAIAVSPWTGELFHSGCFGTWVYPPPYESPDAMWHTLVFRFNVLGWQVLADHGPAGTVARPVTDGDTEPRIGGLQALRVTFSDTVDPATLVPGAVVLTANRQGDLTGLIQGMALDGSGTELTITLSEPPEDRDTVIVTLTETLTNLAGEPVGGDSDLTLHLLAGDVDASGAVTEADVVAIRSGEIGQVVTPAQAAADINRDGTVSGDDLKATRRRIGTTLP